MSTPKPSPKRTRSKLVVEPTSATKLYNMTELSLAMDVTTRHISRIRDLPKSPFFGEFSRPDWVLTFLERVLLSGEHDLKNFKIMR